MTNNHQHPPHGVPAPLGASVQPDGINFSVYSQPATALELLLFDGPDEPAPSRVIALDPQRNRTRNYWHLFVPDLGHGQVYAWRAAGPHRPHEGLFMDSGKVLLDPYGRGVTGYGVYDRQAAADPGRNTANSLRSVAIDPDRYDWEGDRPLPSGARRDIIYEMHVGAFTADPESGVGMAKRGTYAGVIEKIGYLKALGVTAVELLPIHAFDPQSAPPGRTNYWGYNSVNWFAPHPGYSTSPDPAAPCDEFRDMVKALHRAGLRVILDVVYNHTAESDATGPVLSWRGLAGHEYYIAGAAPGTLLNSSGCGNTVNANHPVTKGMILDSLRYWVEVMHVDGFRFDLASALTRGAHGRPLDRPPLIEAIAADPILAHSTLIAEAWDADGLYQVGSFGGDRFAEWNGPFRDDIRRFLRGDPDTIEALMARLVGSHDIFAASGRRPFASVNYVTCHDGFTLRDLVSYAQKHNDANGENNRDGSDDNLSWNCGHEGPTADQDIGRLRERQMRNFLCLLMLAHGTPMLLSGDELGQSRQGNNNPWCQDNELNWLDWSQAHDDNNLLRFTRKLIALTKSLTLLQTDRYWHATNPDGKGDLSWHGPTPGKPDWSPGSRALAFSLESTGNDDGVHIMMNAGQEELLFQLPPPAAGTAWVRLIDTALPGPEDIRLHADPEKPPAGGVTVAPHSIAVWASRR